MTHLKPYNPTKQYWQARPIILYKWCYIINRYWHHWQSVTVWKWCFPRNIDDSFIWHIYPALLISHSSRTKRLILRIYCLSDLQPAQQSVWLLRSLFTPWRLIIKWSESLLQSYSNGVTAGKHGHIINHTTQFNLYQIKTIQIQIFKICRYWYHDIECRQNI